MTSYREWIQKNPGKALDDIALKQIMERTNNLMINLGRANRAAFQKGAVGVTTQFLQVGAKTVETLLGLNKNLTAAERMKLLGTQMLLYGSAGVGVNALGGYILGAAGFKQSEIEAMDPEIRKAINEGFTGYATLAVLGVDMEVGARSSLLNAVTEFTDKMLFDDTPFVEMVAGAFGATANRFWQGMTQTLRPVMYGEASVRDIDYLRAMRSMLSTISTWNNAEKALLMNNMNVIMSRSGKTLRKRDFTAMEEFMTAIGFRTSEEVQVYDLQNLLRAKKQFEGKLADSIVQEMANYARMNLDNDVTESETKAIADKIAALYQTLPPGAERESLRNTVQARLVGPYQDEYARVFNQFYKQFTDGRTGDVYNIHNMLSGYGIRQKSEK